jgi:hypothetical protein
MLFCIDVLRAVASAARFISAIKDALSRFRSAVSEPILATGCLQFLALALIRFRLKRGPLTRHAAKI